MALIDIINWEVFTREEYPIHWAGVQHNLGVAYATRQNGIKLENIENSIRYEIAEASKWRSGIGIKGKNKKEYKEKAIEFVKNKFNVDVCEDTSEAICIGYYAVINEVI